MHIPRPGIAAPFTYCIPLVAIGPVIVIVAGRWSPAGASLLLVTRRARSRPGERRFPVSALVRVRIPAALPQFLASARISIPGAIVGSMLAEWLVGFEGMGGILSG